MKNVKRLIAILLLAALLLCLTGCKKKNTPEEPEPFVVDENILMPEGTLIG